ncbi:MAG TPA: NAD(+) diphosphatase [Ktedonobacteraceae bacterium]|nr:NAD(+) diphosphatase [Ktedonobacteraceae bacterium]
MVSTFQRAYPPAIPEAGPAYWFPFRGNELIVQKHEEKIGLIHTDEAGIAALQPYDILYIGTINGVPCMACEVSVEQPVPQGWRALSLRALYGQLDDSAYSAAGYASQILHWQRNSRFCPACGAPNGSLGISWERRCTLCSYIGYPSVIPAVLILVYNGDQILLAHQPGWGKRYSILAGFVEPGETLEECVRREVAEEVGIEITDVTYMGSQSWPFPTQLMVGFQARYLSGELHPDQQELDDAAWFRVDALPELPPPLSLSRQLINRWANSVRTGQKS